MRPLLFALALLAAPPAQAQTSADLAWLEGCWLQENQHRRIVEVWNAPPAAALFGYSLTLIEDTPSGWEQMRIDLRDGAPAFVAMPNGAPETRFALAESGPQRVAFENPAHDFPQRVEYRREGEALFARVSTGEDGFDFQFRRVDCAAIF